jgi:hypothetical protein
MNVTKEELDRFHDFAVSVVSDREPEVTWLQLFELWRVENPSADEHRDNIAAVYEALQAMDAGKMRPFSAFDAEFRTRHNITENA